VPPEPGIERRLDDFRDGDTGRIGMIRIEQPIESGRNNGRRHLEQRGSAVREPAIADGARER
jgi:hypothetical protein